MNLAFWEELPQTLTEIDAHRAARRGAARALIISGVGRHFAAGIDMEAVTRTFASRRSTLR